MKVQAQVGPYPLRTLALSANIERPTAQSTGRKTQPGFQ